MSYAIVDIETTGGSAKTNKITEIAIIIHDGEKEVERYETLINPERNIPYRISALTGITDEMVADAPKFHEVAKRIWELTENHVFVAHNVNFDYSFIREEYARLGAKWQQKRLCTVRLSRKIMPGLPSYSLGKLAKHFGYEIEGRHRAMGDADFTVTLFEMLLEKDKEDHMSFALNARSREATMPPNLDRTSFDRVPETMGVYTFYGEKNRVIYIGKANNLKKRVSEHFRGNTHTGFKGRFTDHITHVDFIECPNELIALLTEAREIKKHWPPYNDLMKRISLNWGIFSYYDQNGFGRFSVGRVGKWEKPIVSFRNKHEARSAIERVQRANRLCARYTSLQDLMGHCLEELHGPCNGACVGDEAPKHYNDRYEIAKDALTLAGDTLIIKGEGFSSNEQSIVLMEKGRYKGHGIVSKSLDLTSIDEVKSLIEPGYDDQDIQGIIRSHIFRQNASILVY
jgi:DNA polymerase-3 subunit epsilon